MSTGRERVLDILERTAFNLARGYGSPDAVTTIRACVAALRSDPPTAERIEGLWISENQLQQLRLPLAEASGHYVTLDRAPLFDGETRVTLILGRAAPPPQNHEEKAT
jgi:hypothetical protein